MSDYVYSYFRLATHAWEYQITDTDNDTIEWERYNPSIQAQIGVALYHNAKLGALKIEDTDFEIIFDHENENFHQRDVNNGSERVVRKTPEVIVQDSNVFKKMTDVSKMTKLDLSVGSSAPKINDDDAQEFIKRLANCTSLWHLNLYGNKLTDAFGVAFGKALAINTSLRVVNLGGNKFGEKTGVQIGAALMTNTSLHSLFIFTNHLKDEGGAAIICGLKNNTTLRDLRMGRNGFVGVNFEDIIQNDLASNNTLQDFDLDACNLDDNSGVAIAKWLATNTTLQRLCLTNNKLGDISGVQFEKVLVTHTSLSMLYLANNNFGDASGVAFGKALTTNTSLRVLSLQNNNLSDVSGVALVDGLSKNSTLTTLDIHGNNDISPATHAKIKFALSRELKRLLNDASVCPSRIPVFVVGFDNVGKTELVNTWHRTTAHATPHLDPEETAEAKSDDTRDKTSGISIKPITLQFNRQGEGESTVDITVWDFAGHGEYYVSHKLVASGCRDALFVVLFRIDRLLHPDTRTAEIERLFFWLRFVTTIRSGQQQQQQQQLPTVFIGGSFRPSNNVYGPSEWTDWVLQKAKQVFDGLLTIAHQKVYFMDCRKSSDPHVVALRNTLAEAVEATRTREDHKIPPICETARGLVHDAKQDVSSKLKSYEQHLKACQSNSNAPVTPLSWVGSVYGPIMTRAGFEAHVLGKLEVKADEIGHNNEHNPSITPKSKQLLQIITTYLHDVGDILWFDVDGLRDTVILTPDLFCSKIIGAIFRPDAPGFSIDAVHCGGGLVPKSEIVSTFKRALGVTDTHVDAALAILCQLGLCHRHQDASNSEDSYLFPGALAATTYRRPEWFGPLPPGLRFVVGRRFTLSDPATTIFAPGCMSEIQVWALGRYKGSMIWRDGVVIPYTATKTLAEAGVQLHRPHSSSQDGDKCAQVSMSSITLVVRGSDAAAQPDCLRLLDELCEKIRATSGTQLVEEALPPNELAQLAASKETNMLDITSPGYDVSPIITNDDAISSCDDTSSSTSLFYVVTLISMLLTPLSRALAMLYPISPEMSLHPKDVVVVGGKRHPIDSLRNGAYVQVVSCALVTVDRPPDWTGNDFAAVSPSCVDGGVDLTAVVTRRSREFIRIKKNMRRSLPNADISRIDRVQNKSLWCKYVLAKADIASSIPNPREILAWHSTNTTDPRLIYSDWKAGFDVNRSIIEIEFQRNANGEIVHRKFLKANNKSYGTGVYLAEHAIYPDTIFPHVRPQNTADGGKKQLLLAKVVLGNCFDHGSTIPDLRAAIEPEGYHSITGTEDDMKFLLEHKADLVAQNMWTNAHEQLVAQGAEYGRQYVVHRSNQVYPAYLITYETN